MAGKEKPAFWGDRGRWETQKTGGGEGAPQPVSYSHR